MVLYLETDFGRIAYHKTQGAEPGVVFLGGFKSDMEGTKAIFLENWAKANKRAFLRFDYTGHGQSSGNFLDGCIGNWARDAVTAITELTEGPQLLVGSSMGGWISLLVYRVIPEKVAAFVGIAAAPDFTEDSMWEGFDADQRLALQEGGQVALPSDYSDAPYIITKKLIEDGRKQLVLRTPLNMKIPVHLLQGTADTDVDISVALRMLSHMSGENIRLTLIKGADHRFSTAENLNLLKETISNSLLVSQVDRRKRL